MSQNIDRRQFLKTSALAMTVASLPLRGILGQRGLFALNDAAATPSDRFGFQSPIRRIAASELSTKVFTGDEFERQHEILWSKPSSDARKNYPAPDEMFDVIVVGGGLAGLTAADQLRDRKVLLLESGSNFGGNSRGEALGDLTYTIGSAYISRPAKGEALETLLEDLGLLKLARVESGAEMLVDDRGEIKGPFWSGATDPARADEFKAFYEKLKWIGENAYPSIPSGVGGEDREALHQLDSLTFEEWLRQNFTTLHPHIEEFCQLYTWSAFGGSVDELSAAQVLSFLVSDIGEILALPGGNAAIAQALFERLKRNSEKSTLRTECIVVDIKADEDGVTVVYEDGSRTLRAVRAQACIMAAPKFTADVLVTGLPVDQSLAISKIEYRAYVVANIIIDGAVASPAFELFSLKGSRPETPDSFDPEPRPYTDLCFGTWASHDQGTTSVLTLYKAATQKFARNRLLKPESHDLQMEEFRNALPDVLKTLKIEESRVKGIRLTRWGHAIPLAKPRLLARGHVEQAHQPVGGRIFFANQDNWANPCVEASIHAAFSAVKSVRGVV